ncbi:unnamed protein product, partial [Prorocentrum cordatum]
PLGGPSTRGPLIGRRATRGRARHRAAGWPPAAHPAAAMAHTGVVKSFNQQKGWGFIECAETFHIAQKDIFVLKSSLPGGVAAPGDTVRFDVQQGQKGPEAANVQLLGRLGQQRPTFPPSAAPRMTHPPAYPAATAFARPPAAAGPGQTRGIVKSYNHEKGWGFISSPALQQTLGKDIFFMKSSVAGAAVLGPGAEVSFNVTQGQKGPEAKEVTPLGAPGGAWAPPAAARQQAGLLAGLPPSLLQAVVAANPALRDASPRTIAPGAGAAGGGAAGGSKSMVGTVKGWNEDARCLCASPLRLRARGRRQHRPFIFATPDSSAFRSKLSDAGRRVGPGQRSNSTLAGWPLALALLCGLSACRGARRPESMHGFGLPGAAFEGTAPGGADGGRSPCSSSSGEWAVGWAHAGAADAAADAGLDGPLTRAGLRLELRRFAQGPLLAELRAARDEVLRACGAEAQGPEPEPPRGDTNLAMHRGARAAALSPCEAGTPSPRLALRPVSPDSPAPVLPLERRRASDGGAIPGRGLGPPSPLAAAGPAPPSLAVGVRASRLRAAAARPPSKEGAEREDCPPTPWAAERSGGRRTAFSGGPRPRAQLPRSSSTLRSGCWLGVPKPPVARKSLLNMSKDILESGRFDTVMGLVIALNAALIGFEVDFQAQHATLERPRMLGSTLLYRVVDLAFFAVFTAELLLKLYVHRAELLVKREAAVLWNWFDFVVVLMQLLEEAITLLAATARSVVDLSSVRLLRVVRVLKVLRVIRFVPLFSELRRIVSSIMGSLKSLWWTPSSRIGLSPSSRRRTSSRWSTGAAEPWSP